LNTNIDDCEVFASVKFIFRVRLGWNELSLL